MAIQTGRKQRTSRNTGTSPKGKPAGKRTPSSRKKAPGRFATELVGRVGELKLNYTKLDHRTVISHSYFTTPWKLLPPIYLDDTGAAYTLLVNPSGGLKAKGHPIGATGVSMHVLSAMQLTGEAGEMQVEGARLGGIFNMGGVAVANYVSILERIK